MSTTRSAQVTWVQGLQFAAESGSGHAIVIDGTTKDGGRDTGATPLELVLQGLAGCTAMDVISILQKKRQSVTSFQVKVEGEKAKKPPTVLTRIHLKYTLHGRDLSEKAVRDAVELSRTTYCSVSAMLRRTAEITYDVEIHNG